MTYSGASPTNDLADIRPDAEAIRDAGWNFQEASDLLAVLGPRLVGIPANRIPHFLKLLGRRTFRSWQAEVDATARARHRSNRPRRPHSWASPGPGSATTHQRAA